MADETLWSNPEVGHVTMSLKRWNARRDGNEQAVVAALQQAGALTLRLDVFDLLVLYRGRLFMMDVKMPGGRATQSQAAFSEAGWPLVYVEDELDALDAIGAWDAMRALPPLRHKRQWKE